MLDEQQHAPDQLVRGVFNSAGKEEDTRTPEQKRALREKLEELHRMFPKALIVGHHDLNPMKPCPVYDVVGEYRDLEPTP